MSVEQMRDHFERVAERRVREGQWSEADAAECSEHIKAAIASNDPEQIQRWADWLAEIVQNERLPRLKPPAVHSCRTCTHASRPGLVEIPGYCGGRTDLPPAYGEGHPLRKLPADLGASCATWGKR
jgi:hypothetical protein